MVEELKTEIAKEEGGADGAVEVTENEPKCCRVS